LIEAGGNLTLENCTIWCKRPARDSGAVLAQGNDTSLTGCLFQDFDRPVTLNVFRGAKVTLRQCMMVYAKAEDNAPRAAVKIRYEASRSEKPSPLVMDHCTVAVGDGSLFDVEGIRGEEPFAFRVQHTLVRAGALLLWRPPAAEFPGAMTWSGRGNRLDLRKQYWVVLPPSGIDGLPEGPTDQASWEELAGVEEEDLRAISAPWADPAASAGGIPDPSNFVLADPEQDVGADPAQVGPHAPAVKK
jgi:serine/threonine-protein kinase